MNISISSIHAEFVPKFDRWKGRIRPRLIAWLEHIGEVVALWAQGNKPYRKYGKSQGTCREHAWIEAGDWLWLTAEIVFMLTKRELPIVPKSTLERVWRKMDENRLK